MTAHDQMRAKLDQLMGTGGNEENNRYQVKFSDPKFCKSFLLGCCPHEILSSTIMDLGECPKIHDLALRADFEIDAMEQLRTFIADCDRRTEVAKQRLLETQEELSAEVAEKANVVHKYAEEIGKKLAKALAFVDGYLKLREEIDELRKKKAEAEEVYRNSMPASSYQQQKLRVCEVCSAYLGIHDNDQRLADHFGGKLHLGFITIREKLQELQKGVEERRSQREMETRLNKEKLQELQKGVEERRSQREMETRDSRDWDRDREERVREERVRTRQKRNNRSRESSRNREKLQELQKGVEERRSQREMETRDSRDWDRDRERERDRIVQNRTRDRDRDRDRYWSRESSRESSRYRTKK